MLSERNGWYANASTAARVWAVRTLVAALLVFHAGLFATHVASGRLADSTVALRWILGVGLFVALVTIRHLVAERSARRIGIVLWLLVALLHGTAAIANESAFSAAVNSPEAVDFVAGIAAAASLAGLGFLLFLSLRRSPDIGAPIRRSRAGTPRTLLSSSRGFVVVLSPRPPPLR